MRSVRRLGLVLALALAGGLLAASPALADPPTAESTQTGTCIDLATADCGGWSNTTPGTANRPYIKYLAVTNAGATTVVIDNTTSTQTPTPVAGTDLYAVVATQNGCKVGQTAAQDVCYDSPNRVSVYLEHLTPTGWTQDFTSSSSANPVLSTSSVIDLVIGFRSAYSSLRWTWVPGQPSYWNYNIPSGADGQVQVKFSPRTVPVMNSGGCSQIPVTTCDIAQADAEKLQPQVLLSMDTTLDAGLTGALFGTESAFIGSLDMSPAPPGGTATLTYGIAAPHLNADGSPRIGKLYALLSSPMLTLLGTSIAAFDPAILSVTRTGATGTSTSGWAGWSGAANGTDGEFLTISDISFSAPKFVVQKTKADDNKGKSKNPTIRVGERAPLKKLAAALGLRTKGAKLSAKVSTPRICKVVGATIKGLAAGTCKGTLTAKPTKGKASKKAFTITVSKKGKRLPLGLRHH